MKSISRDVLCYIAGLLPIRDVLQLRAVCKHTKRIIDGYREFWASAIMYGAPSGHHALLICAKRAQQRLETERRQLVGPGNPSYTFESKDWERTLLRQLDELRDTSPEKVVSTRDLAKGLLIQAHLRQIWTARQEAQRREERLASIDAEIGYVNSYIAAEKETRLDPQ